MAGETSKGPGRWYVRINGEPNGPHTPRALADMLVSGQVPFTAKVSNGTGWISAADFLLKFSGATAGAEPDSQSEESPPPEIVPFADEGPLTKPPLSRAAPFDSPPLPLPPPGSASFGGWGSESPAKLATAARAASAPEPALPELKGSVEEEEEDNPTRDRIVVLGRRQSGKTILLASIYAKLWRSAEGVTAKALSGDVHKQLMGIHDMLREGQWPPSTLGTSQIDLEIEYHGRKRLLVALDFAGELFAKAFVEDRTDWPGVKALQAHIDRAAAVMLLVDPAVVSGMDRQAAMEDDFGLVQAVQRIRGWPGGENVPIVLVLTKSDQHQDLIDNAGGPLEFVRKYFPALVRMLHELPVVQTSAVQTEPDENGKPRPKADSTMINVESSLRFCLREIDRAEDRQATQRAADQQRSIQAQVGRDKAERLRKENLRALAVMGCIAAVGSVVVGLILYFNI